ncbi:MAG: site-specific integrase [Oscillospiraceae bacterium]|nr:site-specific integrase [Oscillospiraceae bacterium]
MTGSLTIKNGKYYAVLNIYEDGKRKKKWINSGLPEKGNKRKAEAFLREKIAEYERLEGIVQTDILFADYIRHWLTHIARKVDEVTMQGYKTLADSHILPYFDQKKIPLRNLDHTMIQRYMDEKHECGRLDGKGGLSPRSLRLHKNIISQTLDLAVQTKLIPANPCQFVELPQNVRYESTFYTTAQLQDLFTALQGDELLPLVKITVLYGLRRSELLGLQWDSIDFERKTMTIRHTVSKVTEVVAKDKTKNASSRRTFPLTEEAEAIFRRAKEQEQQNRAAFGREYQENAYVFKWADGHPYSPDYISHRFNRLLKKHGLPHIRFHELRHSCASLLIDMGFTLKDVQEWLGHSDIKMTANIYAHLDTARKTNMADSIAARFGAA